MSNARQLAANLPREGGLSNRNVIINGDFSISQRGSSGTFTYGDYVLDRWRGYSAAAVTMSQQSFTAGQTDVEGYPKYYARFVPSSAAYNFSQRIEDVALFGDQTLTLSFWMRCSSNKTTDVKYTKYYGSGGSSGETFPISTSVNVTTSWQKFTETFTVTTNSAKTIGAGSYLQVTFGDTNAFTSSETVEIAQVQLERGNTATPFEHRSYGDELTRCQRYYTKAEGSTTTLMLRPDGFRFVPWYFPVTMRSNPTVAFGSYNADGGTTSGSITAIENNKCMLRSNAQETSSTRNPTFIDCTADAEL